MDRASRKYRQSAACVKQLLASIDVGDGQCARGNLQCTTVFGHITSVHTGDHRGIIGACDGDNTSWVVPSSAVT